MTQQSNDVIDEIKSGIQTRGFHVLFREDDSKFERGELEEISTRHGWHMDRWCGNVVFHNGRSWKF